MNKFQSEGNWLLQLGIMILISIVYASIGFMISTFFKNSVVGIGAIMLYVFFIPMFHPYELQNCCHSLMKNAFDFYGLTRLKVCQQLESSVAALILLGIIVLCNGVSFLIIKKRSAY